MLQLYVTVPPNVVLVGVPEDPLIIVGGRPQETAECNIIILTIEHTELISITSVPAQIGRKVQLPLASQVAVVDPNSSYPESQL